MHAELLGRPAACCADHAHGVRVVDKKELAILPGGLDQFGKRSQIAFHAENAIGGDETEAIIHALVCFEFSPQIGDIRMLINFSIDDLGAAEAGTVDYAGGIWVVAVYHCPRILRSSDFFI